MIEILQHPDYPSERLRLEAESLIAGRRAVAVWRPESRRLVWNVQLDPTLERRVATERDKFDRVADSMFEHIRSERSGPWPNSDWLHPLETRELLALHPQLADVNGMRILDVGGTCPIAWRFAAAGAEVHHVDVSGRTQQLALERCAQQGIDTQQLWFHTVPAERLPFVDGCFDLVFSRHSVHHLARPRALFEFRRVLAPGGRLLLLEPWFSSGLRFAMTLRRRVLGIDRGTDDPLGPDDLETLRRCFTRVDYGLYGLGATLAARALGRVRPLHGLLAALERIERERGTLPFLGRALANHVWIVATL